ncbi:MAG: flavin reductase [Prevotellaceae bacterium]|jgi:flavin reductase (DIM6/NTAB) family NADH-FMN oxidoreductase RutF|nr:flavin reductase [Prevotellaceae bacterium]
MNRILITLVSGILLTTACGNRTPKEDTAPAGQNEESKNIQTMNFDELFTGISPEEITDNVFKRVGKDYTVITAGNLSHYNSMIASWGGWGILFDRPATWCFLRSSRYTLELMRREQTYTMSYFDEAHREDMMLFGKKSGRDTDKMKESKLSSVQTPAGNMTYREARLVIECKLVEVTTVSPDDFLTEEGRKFVIDAHAETSDYHKIVIGEITAVWLRR